MNCTSNRLSYSTTGYFSRIITDYLQQHPDLTPFFAHSPDINGIEAAIEERKKFPQHRKLLVTELENQYAGINTSNAVMQNIGLLGDDNTFTITTAHQP